MSEDPEFTIKRKLCFTIKIWKCSTFTGQFIFALPLPSSSSPSSPSANVPSAFKKAKAKRICRKYGNYRTVQPSLTSQGPVASWQILLRNNSPQTSWRKKTKSQKMLSSEDTEAFINSVSHLMFKSDCENSLLFWVQLPIHPLFTQVKMAQSWFTADRKPNSTQVKTYEVWLEQ